MTDFIALEMLLVESSDAFLLIDRELDLDGELEAQLVKVVDEELEFIPGYPLPMVRGLCLDAKRLSHI